MRKNGMVGEVVFKQSRGCMALASKVGHLSTFEIVDEFSTPVPPKSVRVGMAA